MSVELIQGDCLQIMPNLPSNSVDLILVDPPYFRVKGEAWDRQWDNANKFIEWMGQLREQWHRLLKPNGSLYVFASPKMAARVEVCIGEQFNPLNRIRWVKEQGWHKRASKETLRSYLSNWEEIIFAEHEGADNIAKGEAGYRAKCDELRGFIFEPLRAYLDSERIKAGLSFEDVRKIVGCADGSGLPSHWFTQSQWGLPTRSNYEKLQKATNGLNRAHEVFQSEYQELLEEYEILKQEYESLRRPFAVNPDVPNTDVWTFPNVESYVNKHPCEKPQALLEHIIMTSSKPDAVVLDCFMGSGATGQAAKRLGRRFIGIELNSRYFQHATQRLNSVQREDITERTTKERVQRSSKPTQHKMELV